MKHQELEARLGVFEAYQEMRVPDGAWIVVRLEGHALPRLKETRLHEPFDERFRTIMVRTAHSVMEDLGAVFCYIYGEEISALFPYEWCRYDRRVETINSLASSVASAAFTLACGEATHFLSRLWVTSSESNVLHYFRWRQMNATHSSLDLWVYRTLRQSGLSDGECCNLMAEKDRKWKLQFLRDHDIYFQNLPLWQRRGVALYFQTETGSPLREAPSPAIRRKLKEERHMPLGEEYVSFLSNIIKKEATQDHIMVSGYSASRSVAVS